MATQPNFLVLISDQHNPHQLGCYGDREVRTPYLDSLAASGVCFDHCYCPSPLCVPSRMSFMTSRYPSENQVWTNKCMLASDIPTFAHGLGAAGYDTYLHGRMHFMGPDQRHGFAERRVGMVTSEYIGGRFKALPSELAQATGQNRTAVTTAGPGRTGYQAYDEEVAAITKQFLLQRESDKPFCVVAGFVLPHCPFVCPPGDWAYYQDQVTMPQNPPGYFDTVHPTIQSWREARGITDLSAEEIRRARIAYFGLVTHLDRQVGVIMDALTESGLAEDTVVMYTSDHGEMAGEHGMWWKNNFYEGSVSVPLIVSNPALMARAERRDTVCNLIDIGPTLLDLADAPPLPNVAGRSLAPVLRDADAPWEDETFSEQSARPGMPVSRMIRRGPWKLVHYDGQRPQLFNLDDDPEEWHDFGDDPAHAGVRDDLMHRVLADWSADYVTESLARRGPYHERLAAWYAAVQPLSPELWTAEEGDNRYPLPIIGSALREVHVRPTLTALELNKGEGVSFVRMDGAPVTVRLKDTGAAIMRTTLKERFVEEHEGRTDIRFWCDLEVDGKTHRLEREVSTQRSFYEPWEIAGLRIWFDAVDDIFNFIAETHGPCRPGRHARFAIQDATLRICPERLHPWCPLPEGGLRIEQCYRGEDCWLGAYNGASAHGGLDINHPAGTPLWTPIPIDNHYYFNSLEAGHNNNRWRGFHEWPDGSEWVLQAHHMRKLMVPERTPLAKGVQFAEGAGVLSGAVDHSHFVFKVRDSSGEIMLDPWILFWQMYLDQASI